MDKESTVASFTKTGDGALAPSPAGDPVRLDVNDVSTGS
jgi:hypothetical protein